MEQIFITCRELNDVKKNLNNGKIYGLLGITDINKLHNWKEGVKGQSMWIITTLEEQKEEDNKISMKIFQRKELFVFVNNFIG